MYLQKSVWRGIINIKDTKDKTDRRKEYIMAYPVLFVHGMGFHDSKIINYWGRAPKLFEKLGHTVYYGWQDSNGSYYTNGQAIAERIAQIVEETGCGKVNIVAHSKGGLDARYAISTLGMGKYVASLTTLSTPHNGSLTIDRIMKLPKFLLKAGSKLTDLWFKILGDKQPDTYSVIKCFSTKEAKRFNHENPNFPAVRYRSYAFVMKDPWSDMFLWFSNMVVNHFEGENDGFLAPRAVKWGEFMGIKRSACRRGISHCDEVDMRRMKFCKKSSKGVSDILEVYREIADDLI